MTAPAINPEAIDAALPDLDAEVACEAIECDHPEHQCHTPARWRVTMHAFHAGRGGRCSTRARPICGHHLEVLRQIVADGIAAHPHVALCRSCRKEIRQVSDVIISVVAL